MTEIWEPVHTKKKQLLAFCSKKKKHEIQKNNE